MSFSRTFKNPGDFPGGSNFQEFSMSVGTLLFAEQNLVGMDAVVLAVTLSPCHLGTQMTCHRAQHEKT